MDLLPKTRKKVSFLEAMTSKGHNKDGGPIDTISLSANGTDEDIQSLEGLQRFPQVKRLEIPFHSISRIVETNYCKELTELSIYNNKIKEIENLEWCTKLERLYLQNNLINFMPQKQFHALKFLKVLRLDGNRIRNISGLDKCFSLTELDLSNNEIESTEGLNVRALTHLSILRLSNNRITHLGSGLTKSKEHHGFPELSELHLDGNQITSLSNLVAADTLDELVISNNPLGDNKLFLNDVIPQMNSLTTLTARNLQFIALEGLNGTSLQNLLPKIEYIDITRQENLPTLNTVNESRNQESIDKVCSVLNGQYKEQAVLLLQQLFPLRHLDKLVSLEMKGCMMYDHFVDLDTAECHSLNWSSFETTLLTQFSKRNSTESQPTHVLRRVINSWMPPLLESVDEMPVISPHSVHYGGIKISDDSDSPLPSISSFLNQDGIKLTELERLRIEEAQNEPKHDEDNVDITEILDFSKYPASVVAAASAAPISAGGFGDRVVTAVLEALDKEQPVLKRRIDMSTKNEVNMSHNRIQSSMKPSTQTYDLSTELGVRTDGKDAFTAAVTQGSRELSKTTGIGGGYVAAPAFSINRGINRSSFSNSGNKPIQPIHNNVLHAVEAKKALKSSESKIKNIPENSVFSAKASTKGGRNTNVFLQQPIFLPPKPDSFTKSVVSADINLNNPPQVSKMTTQLKENKPVQPTLASSGTSSKVVAGENTSSKKPIPLATNDHMDISTTGSSTSSTLQAVRPPQMQSGNEQFSFSGPLASISTIYSLHAETTISFDPDEALRALETGRQRISSMRGTVSAEISNYEKSLTEDSSRHNLHQDLIPNDESSKIKEENSSTNLNERGLSSSIDTMSGVAKAKAQRGLRSALAFSRSTSDAFDNGEGVGSTRSGRSRASFDEDEEDLLAEALSKAAATAKDMSYIK